LNKCAKSLLKADSIKVLGLHLCPVPTRRVREREREREREIERDRGHCRCTYTLAHKKFTAAERIFPQAVIWNFLKPRGKRCTGCSPHAAQQLYLGELEAPVCECAFAFNK
jgi:hypothetical protein